MKTKNYLLILLVAIFFSGCVIWSFYPLYTEKDLFANEILTGTWLDDDSMQWNFKHPVTKTQTTEKTDSTSYELNYIDCDSANTTYDVHLVKLEGNYFLDFYLTEIKSPGSEAAGKDIALWTFHVFPVHTFAKLTFTSDTLKINWFDKDWLYEQIKGKKLKIKHEYDGQNLLLTAKTADLQKLVVKYANSPEAFKDGLNISLTRKAE